MKCVRTCPACKKKYSVTDYFIILGEKFGQNIKGHCSLTCQKKTKRHYFVCLWCRKESWKYKRDIERGHKEFCCKKCSVSFIKA